VDRGLSLSVVWRITRHLKPAHESTNNRPSDCLEDNKALEAREGVSTWLDHRDPRDGEMALFASKMLSVNKKQRVLPRQS